MYRYVFKRLFDIVLAFLIIVLLAVPMLIIALITMVDSRGHTFFMQKRCGKGRKPFVIIKFRSLPISAPGNVPTNALKHMTRTRWQRWLRQTSVDELPQLFNILKGDMSFVGPRPVILAERELIDERDRYGANDIRPGLTGWAQINGRDELNFKDKAQFDGQYVRHISFAFDMRCLYNTFFSVLRQDGVRKEM